MSGWKDVIWTGWAGVVWRGFLNPFGIRSWRHMGPEEWQRREDAREEETAKKEFATGRLREQLKQYERSQGWRGRK